MDAKGNPSCIQPLNEGSAHLAPSLIGVKSPSRVAQGINWGLPFCDNRAKAWLARSAPKMVKANPQEVAVGGATKLLARGMEGLSCTGLFLHGAETAKTQDPFHPYGYGGALGALFLNVFDAKMNPELRELGKENTSLNKEIANLNEEVVNLGEEKSDLNKKMDSLYGEIRYLKSNVDRIKTDITTLSTEVEDLKTKIGPLAERFDEVVELDRIVKNKPNIDIQGEYGFLGHEAIDKFEEDLKVIEREINSPKTSQERQQVLRRNYIDLDNMKKINELFGNKAEAEKKLKYNLWTVDAQERRSQPDEGLIRIGLEEAEKEDRKINTIEAELERRILQDKSSKNPAKPLYSIYHPDNIKLRASLHEFEQAESKLKELGLSDAGKRRKYLSQFEEFLRKNRSLQDQLRLVRDTEQNLSDMQQDLSDTQQRVRNKEQQLSDTQQQVRNKEQQLSDTQQQVRNKQQQISDNASQRRSQRASHAGAMAGVTVACAGAGGGVAYFDVDVTGEIEKQWNSFKNSDITKGAQKRIQEGWGSLKNSDIAEGVQKRIQKGWGSLKNSDIAEGAQKRIQKGWGSLKNSVDKGAQKGLDFLKRSREQ